MPGELRGRTFSPADDWFAGGPEFALAKLEQVDAFLRELAAEVRPAKPWWISRRRWHRRTAQEEYDLEDAGRTVGDARAVMVRLRNELGWRAEGYDRIADYLASEPRPTIEQVARLVLEQAEKATP